MKTVLITGASQGVGLVTARTFAAAGYQVAGVDIKRELLAKEMEKLSADCGVATLTVEANVREEQQVIEAVKTAIDKFGSIDVLVNNAGIRKLGTVWESSLELWDEIQSTNLRGQFLFAREVLNQGMLARGNGKIIFVSSIAGRRGSKQSSAYCASKWGIRGLAASLSQDLKGTDIHATVITPGRTDTPMARESEQWNPDIGWLDPQAIANAIRFFADQEGPVEMPEIHLHVSAEL